jgi:hypothetical protein
MLICLLRFMQIFTEVLTSNIIFNNAGSGISYRYPSTNNPFIVYNNKK